MYTTDDATRALFKFHLDRGLDESQIKRPSRYGYDDSDGYQFMHRKADGTVDFWVQFRGDDSGLATIVFPGSRTKHGTVNIRDKSQGGYVFQGEDNATQLIGLVEDDYLCEGDETDGENPPVGVGVSLSLKNPGRKKHTGYANFTLTPAEARKLAGLLIRKADAIDPPAPPAGFEGTAYGKLMAERAQRGAEPKTSNVVPEWGGQGDC